ncbi:glycosyltransferase [Commensalibacter papalotli (ex Botero et al. 2024)]|uniref:Glycosyltransferase involved in cell wall bisynthesis (RfaB) (PDB:2IV7) n=1 Tax=Commensalibacter papalotli (ex Botero et al. 2024) TaxID=2972766 RepID=A0ABM9HSU3_9PROT|nr:glycosyltransferase [Commensalibacter papalotli (ex Botero et al. 2024)]CAI3952676.1 Glycosyltransferase involved in cell wall bisynthesis (RfaB) (PDB:2IV7) [Commensalibacter papalotli (ex Botero et al. 2024)]CAI3953205.1 Glycosyltransferase involved in cell wall bisynthesis (RfaB) (PDB:2IV7) [Commensalibacter papalotli (ex Botero et al. 2024)]
MTYKPSSSSIISLQDILSYYDDWFTLPIFQQNPLPHQAFLAWLTKNTTPKKIAIFDTTDRNTQGNLCTLIYNLGISSQCYGIAANPKSSLPSEILIPLTSEIPLSSFSLIYIDISNQTIKSNPHLSTIQTNVPTDTIFIFNNLYSQNSIAKENRKLINQWKDSYPHFELSHQDGLLTLYTGIPKNSALNELFSLKNTPKLEQVFKTHCALLDDYWQLKTQTNNAQEINNKEQILKAKTETYLLQQDIYYREKAYKSSLEHVQTTTSTKIETLRAQNHNLTQQNHSLSQQNHNLTQQNHSLSQQLEIYTNTYHQLSISQQDHEKNILIKHPRHIIFIAGEPNTPGVIYRCYRNAEACTIAGHEAKVINAADVSPDDIQWADILILWRVEFSGHILGIVELAKEYGTLTAFDADDIVFKPHFAYIEIIDGIRTIGTTEAETSRTFGNMKQTLMRTDFATATTQEMREHMAQELMPKHAGPLVFILPNIFDDDCVRISRFFSRIKIANKNDNYIRIGYASGTRTHQRDFALVIPALLTIFRKRPDVRLVLFREPENHRPILHMNEFPELNDFQDRIEWRDTVPLKQLPQELARFDISIAPLEAENVFCNAKSELKFFEAALANVCSVVSPTGPLTRCIQHGITGFLAKNTEEWETYLLTLIDDPSLRRQVAQNAYHDVLWNFGIQRQSHLCDTMMLSLTGEKGAAQAMETIIARKDYKNLGMPIVPESEILFEHDALQESEVTVVITSYNYSNYIIEAMESVRAQTLKYIDLIVVDDGSSDDSVELIITWAKEHKNRFNRLQLHRSLKNVGLGGARNIGIAASETLYSMQLDADNRLLPDSCEKLLAKIQGTAIGYAYPHLRHFGAGEAIGGHVPYHPLRLTVGNYIDAMVMLAKWAWAAAGGYYVQRDAMGWEDYDIWCRLAELGIQGTQVKDAIAEYRAHVASMTNTVTEQTYHKPKVTSYLAERHPWVKLVLPEESPWVNKNK